MSGSEDLAYVPVKETYISFKWIYIDYGRFNGNPIKDYFVAALGDKVPAVSPGKIAEAQPEDEIASDDGWLGRLSDEQILGLLEIGSLFPQGRLLQIARRAGVTVLAKYPRLRAFLANRQGSLPLSRLAGRESWTLTTTPRQLQAKFKHAKAFGVEGNYSAKTAAEFEKALRHHIYSNPNTQRIVGTFRGKDVIHYVDSKTTLNVMTEENGAMKRAWKLEPDQLRNVLTRGTL